MISTCLTCGFTYRMHSPTDFRECRCGQGERLPPSDPNVANADRPRLSGQNARILARLRKGPATNAELAEISLKYTSRISDLRAAGYGVLCETGQGGVNWYRLKA
jgi:hypothetical protein